MGTRMEDLMDAARKAGAPDVPDRVDDLEPDEGDDKDTDAPARPESGTDPNKPTGNEPEKSETERLDALPENFFGRNIREFGEEHGVEAAEALYEQLQSVDRDANRRFREIAELRKTAEAEAAAEAAKRRFATQEPDEPDEQTPEQILTSLGISPDILEYEELGQPVATLATLVAKLSAQMEAVEQSTTAQHQEQKFWESFHSMEKKYASPIPADITQEDIETFALERGIYDPEALYKTIMADVWREAAMNPPKPKTDPKRREEKKSASMSRRRGAASGATQNSKAKTLLEHFENAKKEHGVVESDPFKFE